MSGPRTYLAAVSLSPIFHLEDICSPEIFQNLLKNDQGKKHSQSWVEFLASLPENLGSLHN